MMRPIRCTYRSRRRGFSMLEMIVAALLAAMLGALLVQAFITFGRPALEVEARARITQEAILATQSLACDLGGFLADSAGRTGTISQYQFANPPWDVSQGTELLLNFQGLNSGDVIVIIYQLQDNSLVRSNSSTGVTTTIANYVTGFSVQPEPGSPSNQMPVNVTFTFCNNFTSTYSLINCESVIMMRSLHANQRRGYSLLVVMVTLMLLSALWAAVSRTTSGLLRIETSRVLQQTRDQAAMNAWLKPSSSCSSTASLRTRQIPVVPSSHTA